MNTNYDILDSIHEQFAENQNHHQGLFIQLLIALFILFGGFGYVYVYTVDPTDSIPYSQTFIQCGYFSYAILIAVGFIVSLVLLLLNCVILHLGYSFRRDQVINMKIRLYKLENYEKIFEDLYKPTNKSCFKYLPDFYAIFFWAITILQLIIFISLCTKEGLICFSGHIFSLLIFLACFLLIVVSICLYFCKYNKYKKLG